MLRALPLLREAGYGRIVLAGQSRGGWQSIMAAAERLAIVLGAADIDAAPLLDTGAIDRA